MKIALTQGKVTLIDDADWPLVAGQKWCAHRSGKHFYAVTNIDGKTVHMHHLLTGYALNDHANRNGLDNRRSNLRPCTRAQNMHNSAKSRRSKSGFKGVRWHPGMKKWQARICARRKEEVIGYFETEIAAAEAYQKVAEERFGEFAYRQVGGAR